MKKVKTLALALGAVLAVGGALPALVFVVERVVVAPAATGATVLLAVTGTAFAAYLATGVGNAVAWHADRAGAAAPALARAVGAGAAGVVAVLAAALLALGAL